MSGWVGRPKPNEDKPMNLKQRCAVCKKEILYFRMVLMMGSRGYRRYALCEKCAEKVKEKTIDGRQLTVKKAGA
jgi:hypothetical protein